MSVPHPRGTVLVVDDEPYVRSSLEALLGRGGYEVRAAGSAEEAREPRMLDGVDAVLTDLRLPGDDGLSLLRAILEREPDLPVIVLTGHGTVPSAVVAVRSGAFDYLLKPANPEELLLTLERALGSSTMRRELRYLRSAPEAAGERKGIVGSSASWRRVLALAEAAAPADTTVLLLGESGTGKEEIACFIHERSPRASAPLVRVNCAAIPADLFESEFFGHRRGAFTGAVSDRDGRFRIAHRGTLFLDEVACLPETAQAKVLRVLENGVFERLGDSRPTSVDVRLVAAANVDLEAEAEAGRFRRDLYYRLAVMTIRLPPLRERPDDVAELVRLFLPEMCARLGKPVPAVHRETLALLRAYPWPGNVRELRNVIERSVLLERTAELLPTSLLLGPDASGAIPGGDDLNLRAAVAGAERATLERALARARGVRREAARLLGIDERNLAYYLKKHGLMRGRAE